MTAQRLGQLRYTFLGRQYGTHISQDHGWVSGKVWAQADWKVDHAVPFYVTCK